jgi:hypothetical protein
MPRRASARREVLPAPDRACYDHDVLATKLPAGPRRRRVRCWSSTVAAALALVVVATACSTSPPGTAASCSRARLARQWQDAVVDAYAGCWATEDGGIIVLTDDAVAPADAVLASADEPPTFALAATSPVLPGATQQQWELLAPDVVRLTWSRGFDLVSACLQGNDPQHPTHLVGEVRAAANTEPVLRPPVPVRLRRVACPG